MAALDPNAWYQITESRVDFNSSLQSQGEGLFFSGQCGTCTNQKWQIQLASSGEYQLKNSASGISKQLSVCYTPAETDSSKTQPCMLPSSGDDSQRWRIDPWGDGTYKFVNVGNGSNYNMDCHPGNPLFMSSQTAATPKQPAQHWEFLSIAPINDGAYSTTVSTTTTAHSTTGTDTATAITLSVGTYTTSTISTGTALPASKPPALSTGGAAGLGIGVGLLFAATLALVVYLLRRNRRRKNQARQAEPYSHASYMTDRDTWDGSSPHSIHAKIAGVSAANELPGHALAFEMDTPPVEMSGTPELKGVNSSNQQPELHQG